MANQRVAGILTVATDSGQLKASGEWTYNLGGVKRTTKVGTNAVHGFTGEVKVPFIEGTLTDDSAFDYAAFTKLEDVTMTLSLYNGKTITLRNSWYVADGDGNASTGDLQCRFEGKSAQEVTA